MYDLIIDAIHTLLRNGLTFSSLIAVLFLLLKNRKLKRHIQQHLPRMLRNYEEDTLNEIRRDVKAIKSHFGLEEEGWNSHVNTCSPTSKLLGKAVGDGSTSFWPASYYVQYARKSMILNMRRIRKTMKEYLKKLGKTKFQALLVSLIMNIVSAFLFMTEQLDIDGVVNTWMPIINMTVATISTWVYILVEGSIDREAQKQNVYVMDRKEGVPNEPTESFGDHGPAV